MQWKLWNLHQKKSQKIQKHQMLDKQVCIDVCDVSSDGVYVLGVQSFVVLSIHSKVECTLNFLFEYWNTMSIIKNILFH